MQVCIFSLLFYFWLSWRQRTNLIIFPLCSPRTTCVQNSKSGMETGRLPKRKIMLCFSCRDSQGNKPKSLQEETRGVRPEGEEMGWSRAQEAESALQGQAPTARGQPCCPWAAPALLLSPGSPCSLSSSSSLNLHVCATGRENPWMAGCSQNLLLGAAVYFGWVVGCPNELP